MLCIITEHKIKSKNGGIFHHLPYTKLTLYLHALQKFTLSDNDYESIHEKKQDNKKIKIMEYSTPLNASKQKREKALVTDEA